MTQFATADLLVRHHQRALHDTADQHRLARQARGNPAAHSPAPRPVPGAAQHGAALHRAAVHPAGLPLRTRAARVLVRAGLRLAPGQALLLVESPQTATDPDRWIARSSVPR
jgi:hypothetical protein